MTGTVLSILLVVFHWPLGRILAGPRVDLVALVAAVVFQLSSLTEALLVVRDSERRARRYEDLENMLKVWADTLDTAKSWPSAMRVVGQVERALLSEPLEWKVLMKHKKIGKK